MASLNDKISLTDGDQGIVKYIGCIEGKSGVFYGIDLLNEKGKNNGVVNGITYFKTSGKKSGKFVKKTKIKQTSITKQSNSSSLSFDSSITINGTKGKVKYIGIPYAKGNKQKHAYYGIQLMKSKGDTDGKFMKSKISYFKCDRNRGTYVKISDVDKQNPNKPKPKSKSNKKRIKNRAKRASTLTISKSVQLTETPADEINKLIASLPTYITQQWNLHYDHLVHNKYKPIFINLLLHLNMMQFHLNDITSNDDEKKQMDTVPNDKRVLFQNSLRFILSKINLLRENANDDANRIMHLNDALVKQYCLNDKLKGMTPLLQYIGWGKVKDMFILFCDGIDSKISLDVTPVSTVANTVSAKQKRKRNTLFVENVSAFLTTFLEPKDEANAEMEETSTSDHVDVKEDESETNQMSNYSLSIIEKLFEQRVRKKEETEAIKSFESQIPLYAKKVVLYDTVNITVYKYEWESWPDHEYKYMAFRAETNQFVRFSTNATFDNVFTDDVQLASENDKLITTPLQRRKPSKIKTNGSKAKGNEMSRVEIKITIKPYQKRYLFLVKLLASNYKWSWTVQQRNTSKKDNNIYLKLAEKLLKKIKSEYEELHTSNKLKQMPNANEVHHKLFDELNVPFYIDLDFVPFNSSIMSIPKQESEHKSRYTQCFETSLFKRVIDMKLNSNYKSYLFMPNKDISFRDIEQGNLPNCGFVAALVSVAHKKPLLIKRIIFNVKDDAHHDDINEHGLYKVSLHCNGILREFCVDDFIPSYCYGHKQPSFTKHVTNIIQKRKKLNRYNVIWVLLIEKCLAKMYGGYDRLSNMFSVDAFAILTGFPSVDIDYMSINNSSGKHDIIWNKLITLGNNKDVLLTTAAHPKRCKRSINDIFGSSHKRKNEFFGMFADQDGHVWSIIRVVEYKNMKLICLRNPWGETLEDSHAGRGLPGDRWKGKYSRYDTTSWTEELVADVQPNLKKNDGTLWMSFTDYLLYFYNLSICYCLDDEYDRFYSECIIKYNSDVANKTEDIWFPKVIIDIQLNDDDDSNEQKDLDCDLVLEWAGIIQQDMNNKNNDIGYKDYLDTCLLVGMIDGNTIKPIALHDMSSSRINYGKHALNIKLKANAKFVLIPYTTGHAFCAEDMAMNARRLCITSFISGNKNNKYRIRMTNDANDCVNTKEVCRILSKYITISGDFKEQKNGDLVHTEKKFEGMIIAAWYHTKNECKFNTTIKFKLDNCLPAVGFDYNRYLMRKRDKFFGQNKTDKTHSDSTKDKKNKKLISSASLLNKKYVWKFKIEDYVSNQICILIIKKHRKEMHRFGYSYAFENGVFTSC
eukprot:608618_1